MKLAKRIELVKAMDLLVRSVNNEEYLDTWLTLGVADGDVEADDLDCYAESDESFAELMGLFTRLISKANRDGGLYCDGIVSE